MSTKSREEPAQLPVPLAAFKALAQKVVAQAGDQPGSPTAVPNLTLYHLDHPTSPTTYLLEPSVCLILQGKKRVLLGAENHSYAIGQFLLTSVDLPLAAEVLKASPTEPYVGLVLKLHRGEIARLLLDEPAVAKVPAGHRTGIAAAALTRPLFDAFRRLVELLDEPESIPALSPIIQREILFRLLHTETGPRIRQFAMTGDHTHRINRVIGWIKKGNLATRFRVEDLAGRAGMSVSTLHHQFRALTTMSPVQYQKRLRLNEARQLMLTSQFDAASAAFQVGYESPSQFTREYSRLFGKPPRRDIRNLLATATN